MHKAKYIFFAILPILLLSGGWVLFNRYIRPNHYQLLYPYSIFTGKDLVTTESRIGSDQRLQVLIPEGNATVGKDEYEAVVEIDAFWIDQIPVTAGDYKKFVAETKKLAPRYRDEYKQYWQDEAYDNLPVVFVSWGQAEDYCEYYGGHLPTEAQWEKAARGADGIVLYWDDAEKAFNKANYDNFFNGATFAGWLPRGKTLYGILDMSGNVREWILDWVTDPNQPVDLSDWKEIRDQIYDAEDVGRMLKGGSFFDDLAHLRLNTRDSHPPYSPGVNRGFRCVYEN